MRALLVSLILNLSMSSKTIASSLEGSFMYLGDASTEALDSTEIASFFKRLQDLKMDTIVIQATRFKGGDCTSQEYAWIKGLPGKLKEIFKEAQKSNIKVYLGLVSTMYACEEFFQGESAKRTLADTRHTVRTLNVLYRSYSNFAGWYLSDEPAHLENYLIDYYKGLVEVIREVSPKPIMISPYLKDVSGKITPEDLAAIAKTFQTETKIDIQAWQDSVGADGVLAKSDYFQALSSALGPASLWANQLIRLETSSEGTC